MATSRIFTASAVLLTILALAALALRWSGKSGDVPKQVKVTQEGAPPQEGRPSGSSAPADLIRLAVQPQVQAPQAPSTGSSAPIPLSEAAKRALRDCLKVEAGNLDDLVRALGVKAGTQSPEAQVQWENIHLELPDGTKRRVRIEPNDSADGVARRQLRLFGLDAEGLPYALKVPKEDRFEPSAETIQKYVSQGKVILRQQSSALLFGKAGDAPSAEVESTNGRIHSIQYVSKDGSVGCALTERTSTAECDCL